MSNGLASRIKHLDPKFIHYDLIIFSEIPDFERNALFQDVKYV